jgi:uncharacterized protein YjbI with pentapeptide repeats
MPPLLMTLKDRLSPIWKSAVLQLERGRQWLMAPRDPIIWAAVRTKLITVKLPSTYAGRLAVLVGVVLLLLLVLPWYAKGHKDEKGVVTYPNAALVNPILGGLGALLLIYAAIRQARTATEQAETARKQAQTASDRHEAQTDADRQRRITENYSRAVEQLAHEKIEVRLGGIYTLERISRESPDDYWTVMETLCAFIRNRAHRPEAEDESLSEAKQSLLFSGIPPPSPPTEIAAVLAVIVRRDEKSRQREHERGWKLDFHETDLRGVNLHGANLCGAAFSEAILFRANLSEADLNEVNLTLADLAGANLTRANLTRANLSRGASRGTLGGNRTDLRRANLSEADLSEADLSEADLSGADLHLAQNLNPQQLANATGDAKTRLPDGFPRPAHWPAYEPPPSRGAT